jgi:GDP-L-fucose synthase
MIPAQIRTCVEATDRGDEVIEVWGSGTPTREFRYVDDAPEAIVAGSERARAPSP